NIIIIKALSFAVIRYPGPEDNVQWLPDASVEFFEQFLPNTQCQIRFSLRLHLLVGSVRMHL
ncbi:MAG: hypothetical protein MJE68_04920, partial [Proteobacteria bacterium]|nr:hypothetical protein [Pseudomonadota bacterium]